MNFFRLLAVVCALGPPSTLAQNTAQPYGSVSKSANSYLKATVVIPESGPPGTLVKVFLSRPLEGAPVLTFSGQIADIKVVDKLQLETAVPSTVSPGRAKIMVVEGNTPYFLGEFEVTRSSIWDRVDNLPAVYKISIAMYFLALPIVLVYSWKRTRKRLDDERHSLAERVELLQFQLERRDSVVPPAQDVVAPTDASVTSPMVPDDLVAACMTRQCVLFAGSGLSVQGGYPT